MPTLHKDRKGIHQRTHRVEWLDQKLQKGKQGSYNYNLLRLLGIIVFFFPYIYINWQSIYFNQSIFTAIVLSSIIGIIIGDTFLFICLKRLGPRRQALLFSMQFPIFLG